MLIDMVGDYRYFFRPEEREEENEDMVVPVAPAKKLHCVCGNALEVPYLFYSYLSFYLFLLTFIF
jgi:hypothetical protein